MYDVSDDKDDKDPQRLQVSAHPESVFSVPVSVCPVPRCFRAPDFSCLPDYEDKSVFREVYEAVHHSENL